LSLSLEKINKSLKSVKYDDKKDPYLHGLKNIESDESEYLYITFIIFMFVFKFRKDIKSLQKCQFCL